MKLNSRSKSSGEGLLPLFLVVLLIFLGIGWYLFSTKAGSEREAKRYGHEVIDRLVMKHDRSVLDDDLTAQTKIDMPPSGRDYLIQRIAQLGTPTITIEDNVTFDSYFFKPHGFFIAHLNYPGQAATLQISVAQGQTKWLIENVTLSMGAAPR